MAFLRNSSVKTISLLRQAYLPVAARCQSADTTEKLSEGEQKIATIIREKFPKASFVQVQDISGGCGAMYEVQVMAEEFRGKRTILQHRMINEALKDEIKDMHGLRISTAVPDGT